MFSIVIKKKPVSLKGQSSLKSTSSSQDVAIFPVRLSLPADISNQMVKLTQVRWKRTSPYTRSSAGGRTSEGQSLSSTSLNSSNSNYSIMTYLNTHPVVPSKEARLFQEGKASSQLSWARLLGAIAPTGELHILWGLNKADKLNLAILLNNEAFSEGRPCRIIYLQSLSILTFWMALTVKGLCEDYHWDCSGYQITLENKYGIFPLKNICFLVTPFPLNL